MYLLLAALFSLPAHADAPPAYTRAVDVVRDLYLDVDEVTPAAMLDAAAEELSDRIDWLVAVTNGPTVRLSHGKGRALGEVTVTDWDDLPDALYGLELAIGASGYDFGDLDLRYTTIDGATDALDRYSTVLVGDGFDRFDTRLKGTLVGIGARLSVVDDKLRVMDVFPDGPAERQGILSGDWIERIDGHSTTNMPVNEAVRRITGEEGTHVLIELVRDLTDAAGKVTTKRIKLDLERDRVVVPNVSHKLLEGNVGYIAIDHVSQKTVYNLRRSMSELARTEGLSRGLVIDLRGNTGGSMKESAGVVDQLVTEGLLLSTQGRDGLPVDNLMARIDARDAGDEPPIPVVVLVDAKTASGAEIITGGLLEHDRVAVLGQRTYGKGKVQKIYDIDDKARLKLTVAEYVLDNDRRVDGAGIAPDVTFGRIILRKEGVRYDEGWDLEREQVTWDAVVPFVDEREDWRGVDRDPGDVELEVARRAVLAAATPDRAGVLAALQNVVAQTRATEEAWLQQALEARGINWSPAPGPGAAPETELAVQVVQSPTDPEEYTLRARLTNRGPTTLHRAIVRLTCDTFGYWDDLVVPIGAVAPGATQQGEVVLTLAPGIEPREDVVHVEVRADDRPPRVAATQILAARTTDQPRLRVEARLDGSGAQRVAHLTVHNLDQVVLSGLEAEFAYPNDLDVELVDHASRRPELRGGSSVSFDLGITLGADVPAIVPLRLQLQADRFGRLLSWEVPLHLNGSTTTLEAPDVRVRLGRPSADVGDLVIPIEVRDDVRLKSVAIFQNGDKVLYDPGGTDRLTLRPKLELTSGSNKLYIRAVDDQGIVTARTWTILGLSGEGVAARED